MIIDEFWAIIEKGRGAEAPEEFVQEALKKLEPDEIASYEDHFTELFVKAYRWDPWGAAYIMQGGCSDDGFTDFRYGLIALGREVYEKALKDPRSLADLGMDEIGNESFGYAASTAHEAKAGKEMPGTEIRQPADPIGEEWDFDDEDENKKRFPKLMEVFW